MKRFDKSLQAAMTALAACFLLLFIAWFTLPRVLNLRPEVVLSGSMEPALPVGAVAFVKPVAPDQVKVGDILTFRHPETPNVLVTHRVTEIERTDGSLGFKTKGDANEDPDHWLVPSQSVIGTVKLSVPYVGYATEKVRTPFGFLLIVGLPAFVLILAEVENIIKELRKPREEEEAIA